MRYLTQDPITGNCYRIHIEQDVILGVEAASSQQTNLFLTPGFCDLQVNGGFGIDLNSPGLTVEDVCELNRGMLAQGVTSWCPTVVTASPEDMSTDLSVIDAACRSDRLLAQCIAGIHLEGPFLSAMEGARGAHAKQFIRLPEIEDFKALQAAAGGRIRIVTLAPEQDGAPELIHYLTQQGIIVSLGHTLANREQIEAAIAAGADLATHLGNGLPALLNRHHNPLLSMLLKEKLNASVIFDGHHLPEEIRTLFRKIKGVEHLVMVSDATRLVGMPPGSYQEPIGGKVELFPDGRLSLAGTPYLAGAAMTLLQDANFLLGKKEFSLGEIIRMAMTQPREIIRFEQNSLVILRQNPKTKKISVLLTAIDNEVVHQGE